jgi:hypothetical protein
MTPNRLLYLCFCLLGSGALAAAEEAEANAAVHPAAVDFNRDIRPILSSNCFKCHGPDEEHREADLRLDTKEGALRDLGGYAAIEPGEPAKSELLIRVESDDDDLKMPPEGDRLTTSERERLHAWILQGAEYKKHWAYVLPSRPAFPTVEQQQWPRNAIDHFVLARLEKEPLPPTPAADPAILLRRVYLDMIGLPPTVAQVDAYVSDPSDDAYEQSIDRLLQSPRFGEKWARHWLDLARYADSNGYHHDDLRSIWPYRDWVVRAMNADKPFDQFTIEQIAGDLLPGATLDQRIATGFHRNTSANLAGGSKIDEVRASILFDRVSTTGTVWLAATFECAQCHDHKFDPFTMQDYYGLFSFFNDDIAEVERHVTGKGAYIGASVELPVTPQRRARHEQLCAQRDSLQEQLDDATENALGEIHDWEKSIDRKTLPSNIQAILRSSNPETRNDVARKQVEQYFLGQRAEVQDLQTELEPITDELKLVAPPTSLVLARKEQPRETHLYLRGNFMSPGALVHHSTPKAFPPPTTRPPSNRLDLARWLVSQQNPVVARATVNRWWNEVFGLGLVVSTDDFGMQGESPTHPDLLNWLAVEFVEHDWSMKHILKLIVMSSTYRQSSDITVQSLHADPQNHLLGRGPRFRLSAEAIRDNALAISGLLVNKLGGPPVHPPQPDNLWNEIHGIVDSEYPTATGPDRYRRGLYTIVRRGAPYPSFIAFDAPNRSTCSAQRIRTNSPLQALNLLNDPVFVEAAWSLATRVVADLPTSSVEKQVRYTFRLCVAREPSPEESKSLVELYFKKLNQFRGDVDSAKTLIGGIPIPHHTSPAEMAAWFHVANALLNLDETITKR